MKSRRFDHLKQQFEYCLTWSNLRNPKNPIYILYNLTIKTI